MHWISTALGFVAAFAALLFAWAAHGHYAQCEKHANRLRAALGRLNGAEAACESLTQQLQKLRGQFHAFKAQVEDGAPPPVSIDDTGNLFNPGAAFCANYGQAQIEGPLSAAARCECGYCVEQRRRRDEFRRQHVKPGSIAKVKRNGE